VQEPIKVLLIEDRAEDAELLLREMRRGGLNIVSSQVETEQDFEEALESFQPDLILSDYTLPAFHGPDALRIARLRRPHIPFIFISGTIGEERAIDALKQGAVDYVLKDKRARLVPAIERALREAKERTAGHWALKELEKSEERFRFAMQYSAVGMALVATDGRWLSINPALCNIVGYPEAELMSIDPNSIAFPADRDVDKALVRRLLAREVQTSQANMRFVRKDGQVVWTQLNCSLVWLHSGPHYFIYQIQDITDRIRTEEALRASEERFRSIAEATQEWIWEVDAAGIMTFSSPAVESILGIPPSEFIGKSCLDFMLPATRETLGEIMQRSAIDGGPWRDMLFEYRHADGGIRWLDTNAIALMDSVGAAVGFRGVSRDVTQRRLQEQRITRLSRIQAVLSGINSAIVRVRERRELFRESCRIAVQQGGFRMAWIGVVEAGSTRVSPTVWEGVNEGFLEKRRSALASGQEGPGVVESAIRHKKIVVSNDLANDSLAILKEEALARGFRSLIAMPLMVADEVVGVLVLYAAETGVFDQDEIKLLKDLAGDISFALDYLGKAEQLNYVSYYDTLTGLANRQLFFDRLAQATQVARAERRELAVVVMDVARFKRVNDTLGRSAGDQLLKELAKRLQRTRSESATPARIGSDRFALIVPRLPGPTMARWIDDWITASFAEPLIIEGVELRTSVKMGIALYPADGQTAEILFANAEETLKRAKGSAEPYLFYSSEMNELLAQRLHLESRLRKAVALKQFALHYQTKVDMASRNIVGLEALLRWHDPEQGLVSPLQFISLLEESGLIVEVGLWVIEQVVADMRAWQALKLAVPRVAVNVSEVQLRQPNFVESVIAALDLKGRTSASIDLEITETMIARDREANTQKLLQLRQAGLRIFVDDFGTGYSGLSQIAHVPLDALKIDRAFVAGMDTSTEHMAIVSTIVNLAKALRIFVVAEGVETQDQAARLMALGCDQAQGYLFSHPQPFAEICKMLAPQV
jgi:diguanylate cyclase (GGDEF)-like protein/PAS domain S-box-containing protein